MHMKNIAPLDESCAHRSRSTLISWLTKREFENMLPIGMSISEVSVRMPSPNEVRGLDDGGFAWTFHANEQWIRETGRILMWAKAPRVLQLTFDTNLKLVDRYFCGFD